MCASHIEAPIPHLSLRLVFSDVDVGTVLVGSFPMTTSKPVTSPSPFLMTTNSVISGLPHVSDDYQILDL